MTTTDTTIAALLIQIANDTEKCAVNAKYAANAMERGERNLALGTLLGIETELDRLAALKTTVLALHRSA